VRRTFEVFAHGTSNSWGFDYNEYGDWFSEACVIPHFWHIIQGGYYLRQSNPLGHFNPYVYTNIETIADHLHYIGTTPHSGNNVRDAAGGGHAHCGLCIYNGDNFPPEYRGRAMMFNIHGQRINQEQLVPEGSGYLAKHLPDFVKANDKNFTGVALKVGSDGEVYFIDWYDREKCHRPQPEVWDRSNGRIYRVKYDRTWKPWRANAVQGISGWHERMTLKLRHELTSEDLKRVAMKLAPPPPMLVAGLEDLAVALRKHADEPGAEPAKNVIKLTGINPDAFALRIAGQYLEGTNEESRKTSLTFLAANEPAKSEFRTQIEASFRRHKQKRKQRRRGRNSGRGQMLLLPIMRPSHPSTKQSISR